MTLSIIGVVCFTLLAGYFSGIETGMYLINRLRIRFRAEQGQRGAMVLQRLASNMDRLLATTLVGQNIAMYAATAFLMALLTAHWPEHAEGLTMLILTPFAFLFADLIPKDLFERRREALLCPLAWSIRLFTVLLTPLVAPLRAGIHLLLRRMKRPASDSDVLFSRQGIMFSLSDPAGLGTLTPAQRRMAQNIMQVEQMCVGDICLPIARAHAISADTPPSELPEMLRDVPYSRLPVYDGDASNITGTISVLTVLYSRDDPPAALDAWIRPPVMLDRQLRLYAALTHLRAAKQRMGIIVDGDKAIGIITINDLVGRILGELNPAAGEETAGTSQ